MVVSPAAGRASTSGSTSSGSSGTRMLPLASHAGACGALRSSPAAAALCRRRADTCAHTHPPHVPRLQQVAAAPRDTHIRLDHRCCRIGELARTERSLAPPRLGARPAGRRPCRGRGGPQGGASAATAVSTTATDAAHASAAAFRLHGMHGHHPGSDPSRRHATLTAQCMLLFNQHQLSRDSLKNLTGSQ